MTDRLEPYGTSSNHSSLLNLEQKAKPAFVDGAVPSCTFHSASYLVYKWVKQIITRIEKRAFNFLGLDKIEVLR